MLHKIYVAASNGAQKNRPKDKHYFEIKYSKTTLTTTLIWRPLYKLTLNFYSLLLSRLPFSCLFESFFHQTDIRYSAVIRTHALVLQVIYFVNKCEAMFSTGRLMIFKCTWIKCLRQTTLASSVKVSSGSRATTANKCTKKRDARAKLLFC